MIAARQNGTTYSRAVLAVSRIWALMGGLLLLAVVAMSAVSITGAILFSAGFAGDVEVTQMGIAVAAFSFLPWCQIRDQHVTADIFTSGASLREIRWLKRLAALVGLVIAVVLLWRMWAGMWDYVEYRETTAVLQIPHWWAFVPILLSLVLTALASVASIADPSTDDVDSQDG